jgi:hypothetical protein
MLLGRCRRGRGTPCGLPRPIKVFTKLRDHEFNADIGPLVAVRQDPLDIDVEAAAISSRLIQLVPGAPWKPVGR